MDTLDISNYTLLYRYNALYPLVDQLIFKY